MDEDITLIGQTNYRGGKRKFGIYDDDRRRHVYVIGKTGVGKTTLLETMIKQDIERGRGVAYVDPHGDTAERLLDKIPPARVNDVVYFNPADIDYPIAFNFMEAVDPQYKYLVSSGLVSSLQKLWADSWGPRLEYILRNTIMALLDYPSSTMLGILRMLGDSQYRKKVIAQIQDPVVKSFWVDEFANYNERFRAEAVSPIQNKVGQFLTSSIIRNIVAQPKSSIDLKDIMDNKKILIINVSKGRIGEDNSNLLGAMLVTRIQLAAMDRASITEEERKDFYLYVDEFQNFATESFASILSEARKYRLNLTLAHQYITQMTEEVRDAVFGNAGTIVSFRVGAADADFMENEFAPYFTPTDLVNLDKYQAYVKLMINGITSKPFSMETVPPAREAYGKRDQVLAASRDHYGRSRQVVEEKIARWSGMMFRETAAQESGGKRDKIKPRQNREALSDTLPPPEQGDKVLQDSVQKTAGEEITDLSNLLQPKRNEVICDKCGKKTEVPFEPKEGQPVYCRNCYEEVKKERAHNNLLLNRPRAIGTKIKKDSQDTFNIGPPPPPPLT